MIYSRKKAMRPRFPCITVDSQDQRSSYSEYTSVEQNIYKGTEREMSLNWSIIQERLVLAYSLWWPQFFEIPKQYKEHDS